MARLEPLEISLIEQNGRPTFIQKVSIGTSGVLTALSATDVNNATVPAGAGLLLQADQDFFFELREAGAVASAVTNHAGARPGLRVTQYTAWLVYPKTQSAALDNKGPDVKLDALGTAAGGNLSVFWVR